MAAPFYKPSWIASIMPDAQWTVRNDISKSALRRELTADDLERDAQSVLLHATLHDGLAAAIVDAEERDLADRINERLDPRSLQATRSAREWYDVAGSYVAPPQPRDVSTGPGAFTWPEPDIVPRTPAQDLTRSSASAPLFLESAERQEQRRHIARQAAQAQAQAQAQTQPTPTQMRAQLQMQAQGQSRMQGHEQGRMRVQAASSMRPLMPQSMPQSMPMSMREHARMPTRMQTQTQGEAEAETQAGADDDELAAFMVGSYTPGIAASRVTTPALVRQASRLAQKSGRASAGGYGAVASRAMRLQPPPASSNARASANVSTLAWTDADVYGTEPVASLSSSRRVPDYDSFDPRSGSALGVPDCYGLYKMPGTARTTAELARRDAAVQRVGALFGATSSEMGSADGRAPFTDALGFRYADRAQFRFDVPKFYPARDPLDKLIYERAAEVAPDTSADREDFAVLQGMDNMIEPLSARYELMRDIARDTPHTRDAYMIPRTGPSVQHPGRLAQAPSWFVPPGQGSAARTW